MHIYGDSKNTLTYGAWMATLRTVYAQAVDMPDADHVRTLLILAGQLEQAAEDSGHALAAVFRVVTAQAGAALRCAWAQDSAAVAGHLTRFPALLDAVEKSDPHTLLTAKTPEGFAYYGLYPEQYALSLERWLEDHAAAEDKRVIVVGIRSIGTALVRMMAASVPPEWTLYPCTVRPYGDPFAREVQLPVQDVGTFAWALVVDEGPGLSGSSMAAVGEALVAGGMARERIAFLPGHGGDPGGMGSAAVRAWWATTPRYVTPLDDVRFDGKPLREALASVLDALDPDDPVVRTDDAGGGLWQAFVEGDRESVKVCAAFERPKYLCTRRSGAKVLWKFAGLQPNTLADVMRARAAAGHSPAVVAEAHGFIGMAWIEGRILTRDDLSPALIAQMGAYIAAAAGERMAAETQAESVERVAEMMTWNVREREGEAAADLTRAMARPGGTPRRYGDGHLMPWEWVRDGNGRVWKTDSAGHDNDHTLVGVQSAAWDVAGAMEAWGMDEGQCAALLAAYVQAGGEVITPDDVRWYRAAYRAFRMGMEEG